MIRMVFAMVVAGVMLTALSQQPAALAQQPEKAPAPKMDDKKDVVAKTTHTWRATVREEVVPVIGLVLMAIILFQLIMLRSSIEKLNEKMGASPS